METGKMMRISEAMEHNEYTIANEVKIHMEKFGGNVIKVTKSLFGKLVEADSFLPMRIKQILKET